MFESLVVSVLLVLLAYALVGAGVTVALHLRGLRDVDPAIEGAGAFFRVLITPGLIALWPWMLLRWRRLSADSPLEPGVHRPLDSRRLRATHRGLAQVLAVLLPLALAVAVLSRPAVTRVATVPEPPVPARLPALLLAEPAAFPPLEVGLELRGDDAGRRQVELHMPGDLERPGLLLLWAPAGTAAPTAPEVLGRVWGPGVLRFELPRGSGPGTLVLHSTTDGERVGVFEAGS